MTQIETKPGVDGGKGGNGAGAAGMTDTPRIEITTPETPMVDVMGGAMRHEIKVLDHGFIALLDAMPRLVPQGQTGDAAIVQAARVSYGAGTKRVNEDRGLIRYLLRHRHTTPFEMVEFKFHVSMPIFIARQWIRHRTANVNEYSGRYSIMPDTFYRPTLEAVRKQSTGNRQGGEATFVTEAAGNAGKDASGTTEHGEQAEGEEGRTAQAFLDYLENAEANYAEYMSLTERGVSRELARTGLPISLYTQWYWKCDLHNILRFLSLRMDAHAQLEIREYAQAMHDLIEPIVPIALEAWRDYDTGAMHLTRLEIEAIQRIQAGGDGKLETPNKREQSEWEHKRAKLGL